MKNIFSLTVVVLCFIFCTNTEKTNSHAAINKSISKSNNMQNLVSIIEIATVDLKRAIGFYQSIFGVSIQEAEMGDVKMGIVPNAEGTVNVVLANGPDYIPTTTGTVIYWYGGDNLQFVLDKVEPNGGKIIVPKTEISPEMGYFALFIDTEGNKMGLHSLK